ncbi:glycosyltransferase family 2 protein [Pseudooceanicola onchidii]|uniref:glycosyltransferase family 2 protein n=1 Tax=Pseudooceanicola onchidii TaxID=2562279 RepID=UPI0010A9972E|nr:glycosyltransferase [Pseudooceanicola onchidii]
MSEPPARACIVIPCYNAETWITRTVGSALAQDWPGLEVVVVDDGSSDGSVAVVEAMKDPRLTLLTGANCGACHARNRGLAWATECGMDYVVFLDADDYFEGDVLGGAMRVALAHEADMVLSNLHVEEGTGPRVMRHLYQGQVAPEAFFRGWMQGDYVSPPGILWRVAFLNSVGGWDESLARAQDLEVTLRALLSQPVIWKNEEGAAVYDRANPDSISRSQSRKALDSRYRAVSGLLSKIPGTSFADSAPLLSRELYHIARAAFVAGYTDLGRTALIAARSTGYRDHPGTRLHRLAARLLGLETKIRLWKN